MRVEDFFHFLLDSLAKCRWSELHAGLDQFGVLRDGEIWILVFVVEDPALALGDDLVAKFFGGEFVSPLAEGAFGKLLNVSFVNQGDAFAAGFEGDAESPCGPGAWFR